jgi:hypothetical protein
MVTVEAKDLDPQTSERRQPLGLTGGAGNLPAFGQKLTGQGLGAVAQAKTEQP